VLGAGGQPVTQPLDKEEHVYRGNGFTHLLMPNSTYYHTIWCCSSSHRYICIVAVLRPIRLVIINESARAILSILCWNLTDLFAYITFLYFLHLNTSLHNHFPFWGRLRSIHLSSCHVARLR
jgi:hypothetical protein